MSEARFILRKENRRAEFSFTWPDDAKPWDGSGTLKLREGARSALTEMEEIAKELEKEDRAISVGPFPPIPPPFMGKIDAISRLSSWAGWEWSWVGEPPAVMEERYELDPDTVS